VSAFKFLGSSVIDGVIKNLINRGDVMIYNDELYAISVDTVGVRQG